MKKSGLILSAILVTAILLGAAAQELPDAGKRVSPRPGPASLEKSRELLAIGRTLAKAGNSGEALADYTEVINGGALPREEKARALFERGLLLDGTNRLGDALGDYSAALALSPKFAAALNNRANVYRRLGRLEEARRDYLASLAAGNAARQYPYYGLGQIAEAKGNQDEARAFYERALVVAPGFPLASRRLAALDDAPLHLHPPRQIRQAAVGKNLPPSPQPLPPEASILDARPAGTVPAAHPELKPSLAGAGGQVQLGAWSSQAQAQAGWKEAVQRAEGALDGLAPHIVAVDLPKGRYYRLRVFPDRESPKALCAVLAGKGVDCIPARD